MINLRRAAIVAPVRTPVAKFLGALAAVPVETLAGTVVGEVVRRSGIDPSLIDDVVFAQSYANGETPCIGRWAALAAGLPISVPGMQLDRRCGGGLTAITTAAMMIQSGAADVVIAGGVESMSNVEYYTTGMRRGMRAGSSILHDRLERQRERSQPAERFGVIAGMIGCFGGMGITAGLVSRLIVTRQARLGLNGPEVIEQNAGVEELDSRDRPLIWSLTGGEQRAAVGLADEIVADDAEALVAAVRAAFVAGVPGEHQSERVDFWRARLAHPPAAPEGKLLRQIWKGEAA